MLTVGIFNAMTDFQDCKLAEEISVAPSEQRVVGNFRLETLIGRGAMGSVFLARHTILEDKTVAIKMLHQHLCTEQSALKRFRQEAESASSLHHPGIVSVQDFGVTDDSQPYLVMDFVDGISLSEVIAQGPLEPQRALRLASQVCDALQAAHDRGLVHRDIKPSNLILTNAGTPEESIKVVDFGIAKALEESSKNGALTQTGDAIGSPPYMSPEQCSAFPVDARSDIYSLGCVLYEMIAGRAPFVSTSIFEIVHAHVQEMPASASTYRRGLPHAVAFDALLLKALAKSPDDRFPSATEFRKELDALRQNLEGKLTFSQKVLSHWKVLSAHRVPKKALIAVGLLALSSCAVYGAVQGIRHLQPDSSNPASISQRLLMDRSDFDSAHQRAEQFAANRDWTNARKAYEAALQAGVPLGTENKDVQDCMLGLANSLQQLGRKQDADRVLDKLKHVQQFDLDRFNAKDDASEIARLTMEHTTKPNDVDAKHRLLAKLGAQARNYVMVKQYDDALNCAHTILTLTNPKNAGDYHYRVAALYATARAETDQLHFAKADKVLGEMSDALNSFGNPKLPSFERAELNQAWGRFLTYKSISSSETVTPTERHKRILDARQYFSKAQKDFKELYGASSPYLADAFADEAFTVHALEAFNEADALTETGMKMAQDYRGVSDPRNGRQYLALAHSKLEFAQQDNVCPSDRQNFAAQAKTLLDRAESAVTDQMTTASGYQLSLGELRGRLCEVENDLKGAEANYLRTLDLGLKSGVEHDEARYAFRRLLRIYQAQDRKDDIKALMLRVNPSGNPGIRIVTDS